MTDTLTLRKHVDYDSFGRVTDEVYYDSFGTVIPRHPTVNFAGGALLRYDPGVQDVDNGAASSTSGHAAVLSGNTWQAVEVNYTITANTVLEFDFYSSAEGEIEGFVFDSDLLLGNTSGADLFQLFGTQNDAAWLQHSAYYDQYDGSLGTFKHYAISVGEFLAAGLRRYFVLVNDNDANPVPGNAVFQNVQLYERNVPTPQPSHAEAVDQLFYYTGQERDATTGLQQHDARWYDPRTGRWLSEDPSGLGPDANLYRYVGNNPITFVDPTGLSLAKPYANLPSVGNSILSAGSVSAFTDFNRQAIARDAAFGIAAFNTQQLNKTANIYAGADLGGRAPLNSTPYVSTGQALRDSGGYLHGVGEVFKGYGDSVVGAVEGLSNVALHPINTAYGVASAIRHPILTGQAIANDYYEKSQTLRGQGQIVGDVLTSIATGATAKAVKEAGLIGKITGKLQGYVGKTPAVEDAQAIVARIAQQQADSGLRQLGKYLSVSEQLAYAENPAAGARYLGKAVHEATAKTLKNLYPGRFDYQLVGPDFFDAATKELVELTTPGQVERHIAKGGAYLTAKYATYLLPK